MKRVITVLLIALIAFNVGMPAFASTVETDESFEATGNISIVDESSSVSEVLTFDELVDEIAADTGKTVDQVESDIIASKSAEMRKTADSKEISNAEIEIIARSASYRSITDQFTVTSTYKPYVKFYCETSEGTYYWGILEILNVGMDREYNSTTKQFGGTVYVNLENAYTIFWIVNGDFYNNGTTTSSGGVNVGVGDYASVGFDASYTSSHYAYCYEEDRYSAY